MEDFNNTTKSSANAGFSFIELLETRYKAENPTQVFLSPKPYPLVKTIEGLGWMVQINSDPKYPQYSLIRFDKGREIQK